MPSMSSGSHFYVLLPHCAAVRILYVDRLNIAMFCCSQDSSRGQIECCHVLRQLGSFTWTDSMLPYIRCGLKQTITNIHTRPSVTAAYQVCSQILGLYETRSMGGVGAFLHMHQFVSIYKMC